MNGWIPHCQKNCVERHALQPRAENIFKIQMVGLSWRLPASQMRFPSNVAPTQTSLPWISFEVNMSNLNWPVSYTYKYIINIKYMINIRLPAGSIPHAAGRVKEQGGGLVHGGEAGLKAARAAAPLKVFSSQNKNRWFVRNV